LAATIFFLIKFNRHPERSEAESREPAAKTLR
jgi:hypothetical protein